MQAACSPALPAVVCGGSTVSQRRTHHTVLAAYAWLLKCSYIPRSPGSNSGVSDCCILLLLPSVCTIHHTTPPPEHARLSRGRIHSSIPGSSCAFHHLPTRFPPVSKIMFMGVTSLSHLPLCHPCAHQVIHHCLKPGGVWVNLGPLLYHWAEGFGPVGARCRVAAKSALFRNELWHVQIAAN